MGIISIVSPSLLQSVDFLTGGFPAQYGDKLSSVFELRLKDGNSTKFSTDVNANLGGFGVLLDGPIPGDGTMVFSVRRGFFDVLTNIMGKPVAPRYWDLIGKATYNFGTKHKISLLGFYYLDDIERTGTIADAGSELGKKFDYAKRDDYGSAAGINWRYLISKQGYLLTTAAWSSNGWQSLIGTDADKDLNGKDVLENEYHLKSELTYKISEKLETKGGLFGKIIDSDHYSWKGADTTLTGFVLPTDTTNYFPPLTYKIGSFIQTTWQPLVNISLTGGLRFDYFNYTKEFKVSPRLGASYKLNTKTTINAAYGYFYQTPASYQIASHPENASLLSSLSLHYIAGIEHLISYDTKISVEAYYKELENVFVGSNSSNIITNSGSGYAKGIEFYLQKKMSNNLVGSIAYTYSVSEHKDADFLPDYFFEFDRPHNFTLVSGYKLSDKWQIGFKFQYASGSPYTPIVGAVQKGNKWFAVEGNRNSERYPNFHKLDIRIDRHFHFENWTLSVYMDLWNAYYRDNVVAYRYDINNNGSITKEAVYDFPLLPIAGINARF